MFYFYFMIWIAQSILNEQLLSAALLRYDGNCDDIRKLVKKGANKNCKDEVREILIWYTLP